MTTGKTARPFAVFDIDGTVLRWQLYHALVDELVKRGHFDPKSYEAVRQARFTWKQRSHANSYSEYEISLVKYFDSAITGLKKSVLIESGQAVFDIYKDQVYTYTRDLIKDLKAKDYLLFAISASQDEIVKLLAEYYGFDSAGGSVYEVNNGVYTGKSQILRSERKSEFLRRLVFANKASWKGSIAVGDSESDIPMLASVEKPIAFNPTAELFDHAKQQNWGVVVERKNMIYQLEPKNGSFVLAKTIS